MRYQYKLRFLQGFENLVGIQFIILINIIINLQGFGNLAGNKKANEKLHFGRRYTGP